ncbi:ferritin family protein, partial [Acidocella aminolytica]
IAALGGEPPVLLAHSLGEVAETLPVVVSSLLAKRGMVKLYRAAIRFLAQRDRDSAALLRLILKEEEAHIAAMRALVVPR